MLAAHQALTIINAGVIFGTRPVVRVPRTRSAIYLTGKTRWALERARGRRSMGKLTGENKNREKIT